MDQGTTRRGMMKACLVAAVAGAVGSASTAARAAAPDRTANFYDAIILGAKTAGLVTAVGARRYGAWTAFADAAYQRSRRRAARGRRRQRHAADVCDTGGILWKYHAAAPVVAGATPTAGGLIFSGDLSGNLLAMVTRTGTELYKLNTGGAIAGGVITYETGGKQLRCYALRRCLAYDVLVDKRLAQGRHPNHWPCQG